MNSIPYFIPDDELELNLAILMITLFYMGETRHGKMTVNNERLLLYVYLIKNPKVLNSVLIAMQKGYVEINEVEYFSVESIAINVDTLFDILWIKNLLQIASSKGFLQIKYKKTDGFLYKLSDNARGIVDQLNGSYFTRVKQYAIALQKIQTESISQIHKVLNELFQKELM